MPSPAPTRSPYDSRLLEGSIIRSLVLLAVPIMGANILQVAYQLIDAFWVGRLGADAVAAVSVAMPIVFLSISAGMGFAIAGTTLIAQYVGAGDRTMVITSPRKHRCPSWRCQRYWARLDLCFCPTSST